MIRMLYPKNKAAKLDETLFQNPTSEYRGAPFWAWNEKLNKEKLLRQIEYMKEMGFGGFHIHSRTGMATEYLGDEFMATVKSCLEKGKQEDMLTWLYDEDRWPSGSAGGKVTADSAFSQRILRMAPFEPEDGKFLAAYDIVLDDNGCLASYKRIGKDDAAMGETWYASMHLSKKINDCNGNTYTDTLNKKAIQRFTEITHDRYKEVIGEDFGAAVPAIFTDEPQTYQRDTLPFARSQKPVTMPWTEDFPETFKQTYSKDILDALPEVFWQLPGGKVSQIRYFFHDHLTERFADAYADTLGAWCDNNGLSLTGHMMAEASLAAQTRRIGEAMRHYRSFTLPGIDMLCDRHEYSTAKQAQSVARQSGREGVMSELYGVTGWQFDFRGHKLQGDWQAALGVTVRVPHLYWVSMAGEAKRDYPAPIGHQSPWFREYPLIENHFARLNTALTRGKPISKVGVIHPIESFWLAMGPREQTFARQKELQDNFESIIRWLLFGQMDFDFISEALLPAQCEKGSNPLRVGEMAYDAIVVPSLKTLRKTTFDRLRDFQKAGGKLIIMGEAPTFMDAAPSEELKSLTGGAVTISFTQAALMDALEEERLIDVRVSGSVKPDNYNAQVGGKTTPGSRCGNLLYQLRQDGDARWLFLCHGDNPQQLDTTMDEPVQIRLRGHWKPTVYDTLTGSIKPIGASYQGGWTYLEYILHPCASLLLRLEERTAEAPAPITATDRSGEALRGVVPVTLTEPNVLLLDMAQYRLDDESVWQSEEEILRLDNICRQRCGYPPRTAVVLQPWAVPEEPIIHTLHLKFTFHSDLEISGASLALEDAEKAVISMNSQPVSNTVTGWYVDECIKTVALPAIQKGENVIEASIPFGKRTDTEAMYLLGDFGVRVCGTYRTLTKKVTKLGFGSITEQGLPYYGGNVIYHLPLKDTADVELGITHYRGTLMTVSVAGKRVGEIVFPPYRLPIRDIPEGTKTIDVTLFGNRYNTFGPLHNYDPATTWWGPAAGRPERDAWGYEYNFRPTGILTSPVLRKL